MANLSVFFFLSWIHWIFAEDREDPKEKVLGTIFQSMRRRPTHKERDNGRM